MRAPFFCGTQARPGAQSVVTKQVAPFPTGSSDEHATGAIISAPANPPTTSAHTAAESEWRDRFSKRAVTKTAYHAAESTSQLVSWPSKRGLSQRDEDIPLVHGLTLGAVDFLDGSAGGRLDRHLHFHGLEDHAGIPLGDGRPLFDLDFPHGAGDVRDDVRRHGPQPTQFYVRLRVPKNMMNGAPPLRGKGKSIDQRLRIEAKAGSFPSARNDTTMAEQKESSVLFSLKELMNLEEDRIKQEETERQRQEQAVVNARLEAERKAREEEEARMAAAEEQRRQGEQRSREEQARLEAIRHAEIEKARLDAENAARLEQLRAHQAHEQNITALKQDKGKKNLLFIAIGAGILLVVVMIGGGIAIKGQMDKAAALQAQLGQLAQDEADIKSQMANASAEDKARLQAELDAKEAAIQNLKDHPNAVQTTAPVSHPVAHTGGGGGGGGSKPASTKPPCNCTPGDPLCSCL